MPLTLQASVFLGRQAEDDPLPSPHADKLASGLYWGAALLGFPAWEQVTAVGRGVSCLFYLPWGATHG